MLTASAVASAAPASLDDVLSRLELSDDAIALRYREIRDVTLLKDPVVTPGHIRIHRDGRIRQRWVSNDGTHRLRVDGDQARLTTPDGRHRFQLARRPRLAALITALRAVTQGDAERLRRHFAVEVSGQADDWQLLLTSQPSPSPNRRGAPPSRNQPPQIAIHGGERIQRIRLQGGQREREIVIEQRQQ